VVRYEEMVNDKLSTIDVKGEQQMEEQVGSVILINTFTVEPEEADQLQETGASDAAFMKQQPGFISTQLHRGIGGTRRLNYHS
jgi:hypothetical protein